MTEQSRFWNSTGPGDASQAPYDAPTEFAQVMMALSGAHMETNRAQILNTHQWLLPTIPGANTIRVTGGTAMVYGTWYENDANFDINVPTPAGATRIDYIVLRKSWALQTVRLARVAGTEGAGVPALTKVVGTTWEMPICQVSITTGGVMTITDFRDLAARDFISCTEYRIPVAGARNVLENEPIIGGLLVVCTDEGSVGLFVLQGGINNALLLNEQPANNFSVALGTASRTNVDHNGTAYTIQNNRAAERRYRVFFFRGY